MRRKTIIAALALFTFALAAQTQQAYAQTPATDQAAALQLFLTKSSVALKPKPQQPKRPVDPCENRTVLSIVAHQDDDLLFINPLIQQAITHGDCVRTVYVTSGDAGRSDDYIAGREDGVKSSYQLMANTELTWVDKTVLFGDHTATVSSPEANPKLSLVFMHLPDGNLDGSGFNRFEHQSLAALRSGAVPALTTTDGTQQYSLTDIRNTLTNIITHYKPVSINTLSDEREAGNDHSDHIAVGELVSAAAAQAGNAYATRTTHFYGYSIFGMPANLDQEAALQKAAAFFAYAAYDPGVCLSIEECQASDSGYGNYVFRQYAL